MAASSGLQVTRRTRATGPEVAGGERLLGGRLQSVKPFLLKLALLKSADEPLKAKKGTQGCRIAPRAFKDAPKSNKEAVPRFFPGGF